MPEINILWAIALMITYGMGTYRMGRRQGRQDIVELAKREVHLWLHEPGEVQHTDVLEYRLDALLDEKRDASA